jgi:hypothetical protein
MAAAEMRLQPNESIVTTAGPEWPVRAQTAEFARRSPSLGASYADEVPSMAISAPVM